MLFSVEHCIFKSSWAVFEEMAVVEVVSESEVVVRNSALKWTLAWLFFVVVLLIPAIFCLVQSTKTTEQGGEIVPVMPAAAERMRAHATRGALQLQRDVRLPGQHVHCAHGRSSLTQRAAQGWVGIVLLLFALLSCCMLMPFTVVTTTRMDKSTDTFVQDHGLLNCLPFSCIPSTRFPLSEIERIDIEAFDGPQFHSIGNEELSSSSDDEQDMTEEERRLDEEDKKHFKELRYIKPRAQVVVQTKYDSVPITAITSGLPSLLPFRDQRMTAHEIKHCLDRFLGFAVVDEEHENQAGAEDGASAMNLSSGQWEPASPIPEGGSAREVATPHGSDGGAASRASGGAGVRPRNSRHGATAPSSSAAHAASAGGVYPSPSRGGAQSRDTSPQRPHAAARSAAALSAGWGDGEGRSTVAERTRKDAEEMEVDDGMLEFVSFFQRRHALVQWHCFVHAVRSPPSTQSLSLSLAPPPPPDTILTAH
jgi:hypothetical protein